MHSQSLHSRLSTVSTASAFNWRQLPAFDNHEFVIALTDAASGLKAFVAIHSRALGMAHGGTRLSVYKSETAALQDALNLSRAMSYKSALAGLPYGGGKAVIMLDSSNDRQAVLAAYARKIQALNGLFHTGTDVGLVDADVRYMRQYCQYMLGVSNAEVGDLSTGKAAAIGVHNAIKAAAQHCYGSDNLNDKIIGIKGLGKLGGELARLLAVDGALLLLADIDDKVAAAYKQQFPAATIVATDQIHRQPMDIYAPCALGQEFTKETIQQLHCKIIAGGANNQLASDDLGEAMAARDIVYIPDYIANAGGLIFVSEELETDGFSVERIYSRLQAIRQTVSSLLNEAQVSGLAPYLVAAHYAKAKIAGETM